MARELARKTFAARDRHDPLAGARERFSLPDGLVYLDGNSLGALPRSTAGRVHDLVANQSRVDLIRGWNPLFAVRAAVT
jgi:kynureninase